MQRKRPCAIKCLVRWYHRQPPSIWLLYRRVGSSAISRTSVESPFDMKRPSRNFARIQGPMRYFIISPGAPGSKRLRETGVVTGCASMKREEMPQCRPLHRLWIPGFAGMTAFSPFTFDRRAGDSRRLRSPRPVFHFASPLLVSPQYLIAESSDFFALSPFVVNPDQG